VCEQFGLQTGEDISLRQYELTIHNDLPEEKVFHGEAARLNSFAIQKPLVFDNT